MSQIPEIRSNDIRMEELRINEIRIPDILTWNTDTSISIPPTPPVTTQVGVPIIDMPGCVEAHELNEKDNFKINEDDPKGVKTFCDAGVPSFGAMDYNKDKLKQQEQNLIKKNNDILRKQSEIFNAQKLSLQKQLNSLKNHEELLQKKEQELNLREMSSSGELLVLNPANLSMLITCNEIQVSEFEFNVNAKTPRWREWVEVDLTQFESESIVGNWNVKIINKIKLFIK